MPSETPHFMLRGSRFATAQPIDSTLLTYPGSNVDVQTGDFIYKALGGNAPKAGPMAWGTTGIPGFDRVEGEPGNQRRFVVLEILRQILWRGD